MTKEELKALGLTDDQISKIVDDQGKNFVPKTRFNEVNEAKKGLETTISDRDKQGSSLLARGIFRFYFRFYFFRR